MATKKKEKKSPSVDEFSFDRLCGRVHKADETNDKLTFLALRGESALKCY